MDRILVGLAPEDFEQVGEQTALLAEALSRIASRECGVDPEDTHAVQVAIESDESMGPGTWRLRYRDASLPPEPPSREPSARERLWLREPSAPHSWPPVPARDGPQPTDRRPAVPEVPGYTDLRLIGQGGSGSVYEALQTRVNRTVAIKVFTARDNTAEQDHAHELRTIVRLSRQPYIATILDTGYTADGRPYTVMEHYPAGSYEDAIREAGGLPVEDVLKVGAWVGEALHALHREGIVHGDVKPANILRSEHGPALTDLGVSRERGDLAGTGPGAHRLTPQYASPEALRMEPQSAQSDVYSLAATMWALLAGRAPFPEPPADPGELAAWRDRVLREPVPPPRKFLPPGLADQIARGMAKRPEDRHPSALAFVESLGTPATMVQAPVPAPLPSPQPAGPVPADEPRQWPVAPRVLSPAQLSQDGRPGTVRLPKPG